MFLVILPALVLLQLHLLISMNFQDDIYLTILQAKEFAGCQAENFIQTEANGENLGCCEMKLMLLVKWIRIFESYYCNNFDANGNIIPTLPRLTLYQAQELLSKIKILIGV